MHPDTHTQVAIDLGERSYGIRIGAGLLSQGTAWQGLPAASIALIVTNDTVGPLYAQHLQQSLTAHYPKVLSLSLPDGEAYKTWETLQSIFDS